VFCSQTGLRPERGLHVCRAADVQRRRHWHVFCIGSRDLNLTAPLLSETVSSRTIALHLCRRNGRRCRPAARAGDDRNPDGKTYG